jgi:hypothetical protein
MGTISMNPHALSEPRAVRPPRLDAQPGTEGPSAIRSAGVHLKTIRHSAATVLRLLRDGRARNTRRDRQERLTRGDITNIQLDEKNEGTAR